MRDYGKIRATFWTDEKTAGLSVPAKLLACYLLSCPHGNAIGCFRLPVGYICEDLHWDSESAHEALSELSAIRFLYRSEDGWIFIRKFLHHNVIENSNVGKACMKMIAGVPRTFPHFDKIINALEPYAERFPKGYLEQLRQGMPTPEPEPEPEPYSSLRSEGAAAPEDEHPRMLVRRMVAAGEEADAVYWALKSHAAKAGITGSLMGKVLKAVGDHDAAIEALTAALSQKDPRRYFSAIHARRQQTEQLATADHVAQWRAAGIPDRMIRELRPGDHVVKRECTYIVNQGLPTERQYWLDGSPERDG